MTIEPQHIVCFGGGTGLPSLLSGIKHNPWLTITAIVNMFDNGGSSGELKDKFGILPPGDILKCLLALSGDAEGARRILLKRIHNETFEGHTGGNMLLLALERVYGTHDNAIAALAQVLSATGTVVPVTQSHSTLCALYTDGTTNRGEVGVDGGIIEGKDVRELYLDPPAKASDRALAFIKTADVFCIGPGSFYTSVISNLLPEGIKTALQESSAPIIFVANLLTEGKGMEGYDLPRIVETVEGYIGRPVSSIIANTRLPDDEMLLRYQAENKHPILSEGYGDPRLVTADLWLEETIARHDCARLAHLMYAVLYGRRECI
ncbi:MAG: YvcK family protein [bacterium]|nr:YvcK family protein [bacterium]